VAAAPRGTTRGGDGRRGASGRRADAADALGGVDGGSRLGRAGRNNGSLLRVNNVRRKTLVFNVALAAGRGQDRNRLKILKPTRHQSPEWPL
jgi:hypothetical protein